MRNVALQPDGKVIVGGRFFLTTPATRTHIARLNANGTLDSSFDTGITGVGQSVQDIALQTNGKVVVGGGFEDLRGVPAESILQFNADGSRDPLFDSNASGLAAEVNALVRQPDGKLLVGYRSSGSVITKLNAVRLNGIGRLNADGTTDPTFTSPFGSGSGARWVALQSDGKVIVSGSFTVGGSVYGANIARLNPNGTLDTSFVTSADVIGLGIIAIQPDGKILTTVSGSSYSTSIARLNTDGSRDNTFPVIDFYGGLNVLTFQPDGRILAGGPFTDIGRNSRSITRSGVARLNADGTFDTTFDLGEGTGGFRTDVRTLLLQPDGKIIIGGDFSSYNGTTRDRIARLNSNGSLDTSFDAVNPNNPRVNEGVGALALQADGKVLAASPTYFPITNQRYNRVFRLNTNGGLDASFNLGTGIISSYAFVNAILIQPDNNILIGGDFDTVNGVPRLALARLLGTTPPPPTPIVIAAGGTLVNESCPPANSAIDPGERVSVNLRLTNVGAGASNNLVATLQANGNVVAPGGPQNYGAIAPGAMASRTFSFTANGTCGESITLSLQLQDGMTNLGTVTYSMTVGPTQQAVCNSSCQIARLVTTNVALSCVGGNVRADITLQNQGIVTATGVTLTQAQLGSPAVSGTLVPQGPFTLAPAATQNFTVTFATACPFTGTKLLRLKGTSTNAGSWGSTSGVTSP